MKLSWKSALGLVVGGVLLGSLASVAAQPGSPPPAATRRPEKARPPRADKAHRPGPKDAIRSESVYPGVDGGPVRTVRTDRGELEAVEGRTLVVAEEDGTTVRIPVQEDTRIARDGERATLEDLKPGDTVYAVREKTGDAAYATRGIRATSAERRAELERMRQACEADPAQCPAKREGRGSKGPRQRNPGASPSA